MPSRRVALVIPVTLLGALAPSARAAPEKSWLSWQAPNACPSRDVVLSRIELDTYNTASMDLEARVDVEATSGGWRAHLAITSAGVRSERILEGPSCEVIADAATLIVALARVRGEEAASEPILPLPTVPSRTPVPAPAPTTILAAALPPDVAASPNPVFSHWSVHAMATSDFGMLPALGVGASVGAAWRHGSFEINVEAAAFGPQRGTVESSGSGASITLTSASIDACHVVPLSDRFVMAPCAGIALERLAADGFGAANAFVASQPVVVVGAGLGELSLQWSPVRLVAIRASGRGIIPFARPTFVVEGSGGGVVHKSPLVAVEPSIGAVVSFDK
jgi:hypothetical protein